MVLAPDRSRIFISYSHRDQRYLDELRAHLAYYEKKGDIDFWDDTRIKAGSRWYREIEKAITSARIAILLVSADYLASKFIQERDLPFLLEAALAKDVTILSVILRPCAFQDTPLAQFQSVNSPSKPLSSMDKSKQNAVWVKVVALIQASLASLYTPPPASSKGPLPTAKSAKTEPTTPPTQTRLYTYRGHTARVNAIRWSPDGKLIASISDDHTVQIWDATTGRQITTYPEDKGFDLAIAWSPDMMYLTIGGNNNSVLIMEALTGKLLSTYKSEAQVVAALDWSPNGKYLAFASANIWPYLSTEDIVEVIDPDTRNQVFTYHSPPRATATLTWSPDSKYLAFASYDGLVEVLDIASTSLFNTYHGSSDQINVVMWSPDGKYIAAGNADGTVLIWDTDTKGAVSTYYGHSGATLTLAWAPDGEHIASAGEDQTVQVWNVHTGQTVQTYYGHSGMVFSVVWSPDGQRIASAGQDKTVQVWQVGFAATEESKEQWLQEGNAYSQANRYEEALAAYEQAIRLEPNYARSYLNKGEALSKLRRYSDALAAFDQAIRLDPNYARSYHNRGDVLSKLGQHEAAISAYEQALQLEQATGDVVAEQLEYSSLGNVQSNIEYVKEAEGYYQEAQGEQTAGN